MDIAPGHDAESQRIEVLRHYRILDSEPDQNIDVVTSLAAKLLKAPVALTTLVDADRVWFMSRHGLDMDHMARDEAFCNATIKGTCPLVIDDAAEDPRTRANPLVTGAPQLRFYMAAPLCTRDNVRLGALCVMDRVPRRATASEIEILTTLARLIMDQIELRLASREIFEIEGA